MTETEVKEFEQKARRARRAGSARGPPRRAGRAENAGNADPDAKSKRRSPLRDRSIPSVATRLGIPPYELRRAAHRGEVETFKWGGLDRISPAEEARIAALLQENAI